MFCPICGFWLNGRSQWDEHRLGRKHGRKAEGRPPPPPPPDVLEYCRSVLWVIYVRCAVRLARGADCCGGAFPRTGGLKALERFFWQLGNCNVAVRLCEIAALLDAPDEPRPSAATEAAPAGRVPAAPGSLV